MFAGDQFCQDGIGSEDAAKPVPASPDQRGNSSVVKSLVRDISLGLVVGKVTGNHGFCMLLPSHLSVSHNKWRLVV